MDQMDDSLTFRQKSALFKNTIFEFINVLKCADVLKMCRWKCVKSVHFVAIFKITVIHSLVVLSKKASN